MSEIFRRVLLGSSLAASLVAAGAAVAQDYDAGKSAPQLFASDCSACHKGPGGLAHGKDRGSLTSFLQEHYTSKKASAEALAAYLLGAGPGDARQHGDVPGAPGGPKSKTRNADHNGDRAERAPDREDDAKPAPRARVAEPAAPAEEAGDTHEEPAKRGARNSEREGNKGPADPVLGKLRSYGAAGGEAKDTLRSTNSANRLQSYANSGSGSVAPAESGAHEDGAAPKRKMSEKKKKKDADTSASAAPEQAPAAAPTPAPAPTPTPAPAAATAPAAPQQPTGNN